MKKSIVVMVTATALLGVIAGFAGRASAGVPQADHLKCYRLAYSKKTGNLWTPNAHASDALTLAPLASPVFTVEQGCRLLPKKAPRPIEVCTPVAKQPNQPPGGAPLSNGYLCYAMRCPAEATNASLNAADQFGNGAPLVKRKPTSRKLCVPLSAALPG